MEIPQEWGVPPFCVYILTHCRVAGCRRAGVVKLRRRRAQVVGKHAGTATMIPQNIAIPYNGGELVMDGEGLHYRGINRQGHIFSVLISAPFHVLARTRDRGGNNWGFHMQWFDPEGRQHNQTIPSEVIHGDGLMVRRMLASGGLTLFPQPRGLADPLLHYLQTVPVSCYARCSDRLGWHGRHFITATETLGDRSGERYLYQSTSVLESAMAQKGTLHQWQDAIANPAVGNSADAGSLYRLCRTFAASGRYGRG